MYGRFFRLCAFAAPHREGQGPQTRFVNLGAAVEAIAVRALFEPANGRGDPVEGLHLDLQERQPDITLDVALGCLAVVEAASILAAVVAHVAKLLLDVLRQLPEAFLEHPSEVAGPL